jgi:hypothetical protein
MYLDSLSDIAQTIGMLSPDRDLNLLTSKYEAGVLASGLLPCVTDILKKVWLAEEHDSVEFSVLIGTTDERT